MTPFVKWAGGKGQLLEQLKARMPEYDTYYEPFIGGGALLLDIKPPKAIISDVNEQLINVYLQLQKDADNVIRLVNKYDLIECDKQVYYDMRDAFNEKIIKRELDAECAALFIWINKHCFNGLYRVNSKGLYNVPYNGKVSGKSIVESNIRDVGEYLATADVKILCQDFVKTCETVTNKDFVYFDSPYVPVSETAAFTDYTKDGFNLKDHQRLASLYRELSLKGAKAMLSNNDVPLVRELYEGFKIDSMGVNRAINSKADKRKGQEVIITNYETILPN